MPPPNLTTERSYSDVSAQVPLAVAIGATDTVLTFTSANATALLAGFAAGALFSVTIDRGQAGGLEENVLLTATPTTFGAMVTVPVVARGETGNPAIGHAAGATVLHTVNSIDFREAADNIRYLSPLSTSQAATLLSLSSQVSGNTTAIGTKSANLTALASVTTLPAILTPNTALPFNGTANGVTALPTSGMADGDRFVVKNLVGIAAPGGTGFTVSVGPNNINGVAATTFVLRYADQSKTFTWSAAAGTYLITAGDLSVPTLPFDPLTADKGAYAAGTTYAPGNQVTSGGQLFVALVTTTGTAPVASTSNATWRFAGVAVAGGGSSSYVPPRTSSVAYAATVTPNADTTDVLNVGTLTGNLTLANPSTATAPADGQTLLVRLSQDTTGGRTITYGTQYAFGTDIPASAVPAGNTSRTDVAVVTSGSSTVNDTAILATDFGRPVSGTGIPASSFVGTVTPGTSFVLSSSATVSTPVTATAAGTSVVVLIVANWEMNFRYALAAAKWRVVGLVRGF